MVTCVLLVKFNGRFVHDTLLHSFNGFLTLGFCLVDDCLGIEAGGIVLAFLLE